MASRSSIAARAQLAAERINKAMQRLSEREGVPVPPTSPVPYRQPELKQAAVLERVAAFLEAVLGDEAPAAEEPEQPAEEVDADDDAEPTFHGRPLSDFDGLTDDQILEIEGIGAATLKKIREAQAAK